MAEISRFWTTDGTGDGSSGGYTQAQFAEFVRRFWPLHPAARSMPEAQGCVALLQASKLPAETFTIGKSKVFLKDRPFTPF